MRKICLLLITALCLAVFPHKAVADILVTLDLDRKEALTQDTVEMVIRVYGTRVSDSKPTIQGLESFGMRFIDSASHAENLNRGENYRLDYTFHIEPRKTGVFPIGPARIVVGGIAYNSETEYLIVTKRAQYTGTVRGPYFLTASLSSNTCYADEEVVYILRLFHQFENASSSSVTLPETTYLKFTPLGKPEQYDLTYNGEPYKVKEVRQLLSPLKAGTFELQPSRMQLVPYYPTPTEKGPLPGRIYEWVTGEHKTLISETLKLKVLPLPQKGKPYNFNGLVGRFEMTSDLSPAEINAGESTTLTVTITGRGNADLIPNLEIPALTRAKVYAEKPIFKTHWDIQGHQGSKTMKWVIIPETDGLYTIPSLQISYFNPQDHQYHLVKTSSHPLTVLPGNKTAAAPITDPGIPQTTSNTMKDEIKQDIGELGRDILPVHTAIGDLSKRPSTMPEGLFFWLILMGPVFVFGLGFVGIQKQRNHAMTLDAVKAKKAPGKFFRRSRKKGQTINDMILFVRDYVNDRFGLSLATLTSDEAIEILTSKGVGSQISGRFHLIIRHMEEMIYTGKGMEIIDNGKELSELIRQVEKEVR